MVGPQAKARGIPLEELADGDFDDVDSDDDGSSDGSDSVVYISPLDSFNLLSIYEDTVKCE